MDREDLYKQLDKVDSWISNADTKLGIVLAFAGVFSGFIITNDNLNNGIVKIFDDNLGLKQLGIKSLIYLTSIALTLSIFMCIRGLMAKTTNANKTLIFWGHIKEYSDYETFKRFKEQQSDEDLKNDLYNQIYTNSVIVSKKFNRYKWSIIYILISLISYLLLYLISIL